MSDSHWRQSILSPSDAIGNFSTQQNFQSHQWQRTCMIQPEMCSERDSPLEPFVLPAPGQPELARLTCGAHLGPPVLTRKQKRPRVNPLVCDRAAAFCAAGPPEALFWMSRLVTQAAKHERELARAHSQRLKQATLSLPGESVSRGFADRGALEGYPSHYTSLIQHNQTKVKLMPIVLKNCNISHKKLPKWLINAMPQGIAKSSSKYPPKSQGKKIINPTDLLPIINGNKLLYIN